MTTKWFRKSKIRLIQNSLLEKSHCEGKLAQEEVTHQIAYSAHGPGKHLGE